MSNAFPPQFYPAATVPTGIAGPNNTLYVPINAGLVPSYVPTFDFTSVAGVLLLVTRPDGSTVSWTAQALVDQTSSGLVAAYTFSFDGTDCPSGLDGPYKIRPWLKIGSDIGYTIPCSTSILTVVQAPSPPIIPSLVSIAVTPPGVTIKQGFTQQYAATGSYSDGSTQDLTSTATWMSSSPGIATIAAGGLASGIGGGGTTITATLGSIHGSTTLTVAGLVSITVIPTNATIGVG